MQGICPRSWDSLGQMTVFPRSWDSIFQKALLWPGPQNYIFQQLVIWDSDTEREEALSERWKRGKERLDRGEEGAGEGLAEGTGVDQRRKGAKVLMLPTLCDGSPGNGLRLSCGGRLWWIGSLRPLVKGLTGFLSSYCSNCSPPALPDLLNHLRRQTSGSRLESLSTVLVPRGKSPLPTRMASV